MKPRMKNHFRAHQLSIWLRLIPELHKAGMEDVVARHNLFKNHDDLSMYEGVIKPDSRFSLLEDGGGYKRKINGSDHLLGNGKFFYLKNVKFIELEDFFTPLTLRNTALMIREIPFRIGDTLLMIGDILSIVDEI